MADITAVIRSGSITVVELNRGVSGYSGYSGKSGFSGSNPGTSGVSGYSGKSGFSGRSGWSGASGAGTSGYSGWSGFSGKSGTSGVSGTSGAVGATGASGVSGTSGISGTSGVSGISGTSGKSGFSGTSGISGSSGVSGLVSPYVEGSWTPALNFGGAATGITYTIQIGKYTRSGNVVTAQCIIVLSSKGSATGAATITGLPVAASSTANQFQAAYAKIVSSTFTGNAYVQVGPSATTTLNVFTESNGTDGTFADTNATNTTVIIFTITYFTS